MNLYTFPFGDTPGGLPDADDCPVWGAYALRMPTDRLLPFCLTRPRTSSFIDCMRLVDAETGATVRNNVLFPPGLYEKYQDEAYDYLLYYGAIVADLDLPTGRRLRLEIDGYLSAAFVACDTMPATTLRATWNHDGPLLGVPYGTGLEQVLYLPDTREVAAELKEDRRVSKDERGGETVDFLALTPQSTFTTVPLPVWLAQAVALAKAHDSVTVNGRPVRPDSLVTSQAVTDDGCRASVTWKWEANETLVRRGCSASAGPALVSVPADFNPRGWKCGDETDVLPDWQRLVPARIECEQDELPTWVRKQPLELECETA